MSPHSCLWFLALLQLGLAIRIENVASNVSAVPPVYRVSRPQPKQPEKRVPPHLQDIRPGYVDDDAGDVIRIIEPPPHFQQLKRQRQRQPQHPPNLKTPQAAIVWEQPRKLSTNRGSGDLLTQETQFSPHNANSLQLPMEILASVRQTERLLQRQRQRQSLGPPVRQRHIQRQTHTLIGQRSLLQQQHQRGQQQRLRASIALEHKRSKRVKRSYDVAQGLKLVAHIGELLKNATRYLPDEPEPTTTATTATTTTKAPPQQRCGNATSCDSRRRRQRLFKLGTKKTAARGRNFRHEATTTTTTTKTTTSTTTTTTKANSDVTTSATPLASRLVNSRKSPNYRNQQSRSDDSILYADVMSNIRNLWQQHELAAAPQQASGSSSNSSALNAYLSQLDDLAKKLPTTSLNQQEELATPTPSWYLVNSRGQLYGTQHKFPDMPEGRETITTLDLE